MIFYDESNFEERHVDTVEECFRGNGHGIKWIDVNEHSMDFVNELGKRLGVHPLLIEDIQNTEQRPRIEEFDGYIFIIIKMLELTKEFEVSEEQVSLVIMEDTVVSFQEKPGDVFDIVRERLRNSKGVIRKMGTDYLAYNLLDAVVDNYFLILEKLGDKIEDLEDELVTNPTMETLQQIYGVKRQMIVLRRSVWPLREVVSFMEHCDTPLIKPSTGIYLRDLYDHTIQIMDAIETNRDLLSGMLDIYLTSISNRMNEIMKVLTVVGTIFIPLTFIAGLYGMNFRYMPELDQWWGYPLTLLIMLATAAYMIHYFRKKRWL